MIAAHQASAARGNAESTPIGMPAAEVSCQVQLKATTLISMQPQQDIVPGCLYGPGVLNNFDLVNVVIEHPH